VPDDFKDEIRDALQPDMNLKKIMFDKRKVKP